MIFTINNMRLHLKWHNSERFFRKVLFTYSHIINNNDFMHNLLNVRKRNSVIVL